MKKEILPNIAKMNKERLLDSFVCATLRGRKDMLIVSGRNGRDGSLMSRVRTLGETFKNLMKSFDRLRLEYDAHSVRSRKYARRPSIYLNSYSVKKAEKASIILRYEFANRQFVPFEELSEKLFQRQVTTGTLENLLICISVGVKTLDNGKKVCYRKSDSFKDYVDFLKEDILSSADYVKGSNVFVPSYIADKARENNSFCLPENATSRHYRKCWIKTALLYGTALEELRAEEKIWYRGITEKGLTYQRFDAPMIPLA